MTEGKNCRWILNARPTGNIDGIVGASPPSGRLATDHGRKSSQRAADDPNVTPSSVAESWTKPASGS
jgi:hypothetical protein